MDPVRDMGKDPIIDPKDPVRLKEERDRLVLDEEALKKQEEDLSRREKLHEKSDAEEVELRNKRDEINARRVEAAKREEALRGKEDLTFMILNGMRVELRLHRGIGPLVLQLPSSLGPSSKSEVKAESGDYILTFPNGEIAVLTSGLINQLAKDEHGNIRGLQESQLRDGKFHPIPGSPASPPNPGTSVMGSGGHVKEDLRDTTNPRSGHK